MLGSVQPHSNRTPYIQSRYPCAERPNSGGRPAHPTQFPPPLKKRSTEPDYTPSAPPRHTPFMSRVTPASAAPSAPAPHPKAITPTPPPVPNPHRPPLPCQPPFPWNFDFSLRDTTGDEIVRIQVQTMDRRISETLRLTVTLFCLILLAGRNEAFRRTDILVRPRRNLGNDGRGRPSYVSICPREE